MPPKKSVSRSRRPANKIPKVPPVKRTGPVKVPPRAKSSAKAKKVKALRSRKAPVSRRQTASVAQLGVRKVRDPQKVTRRPVAGAKTRKDKRRLIDRDRERVAGTPANRRGASNAGTSKRIKPLPGDGIKSRSRDDARRRSRGKLPLATVVRKPARVAPSLRTPGRWYVQAVSKSDLAVIQGDNAVKLRQFVLAEKRLELIERLKEDIRKARQFSTHFSPEYGYFLDDRRIVRLTSAQINRLRLAVGNIKRAEGRPFVLFTAKTEKQRRAAIRQAGNIVPGQFRFFLHGVYSSGPHIRAVWRASDGVIEIVETRAAHKGKDGKKIPEIQSFNRTYFFPRRPKSWQDILEMTRDIQKRVKMQGGMYQMYNDLYGPIGNSVEREQLDKAISEDFAQYTRGFAGTIIGWSWIGSSLKSSLRRRRKTLELSERAKIVRQHTAYKRERLITERLGVAKRCRKCKKRRCKCPLPSFK